MVMRRLLVVVLLGLVANPSTAPAQADSELVRQTWQMLDYLATDYAAAVEDGVVINPSEYAETREFAATARTRIEALEPTHASPDLTLQADALVQSIGAKAPCTEVAGLAHTLANALLEAYPVQTAPEQLPDLGRGAVLYQKECATCHGASGRGDGPAGVSLAPPPIAFTDQTRADQRSALSLYEVISQGVAGTSMASFAHLSPADRWALAYFVGSLAYRHEAAEIGAEQWQHDDQARALLAGMDSLSQARVSRLAPALGREGARALLGYLRAHPEAAEHTPSGIALARSQLAASLAAYGSGARADATRLALSAHLDGVEPVEPRLRARDSALLARIETAMGVYRATLSGGMPVAAAAEDAARIEALLEQAQRTLADPSGNATATFLGSFTILAREGLEALLIVVALLAFIGKAGQRNAARYVHAGWIVALLAGGATWAVAKYAITTSGAGRELTEGVSSLFAAAVLLSVGLWMHQKSIGGRWQAYLRDKANAALSGRSAWLLFALALVSVYREVLETILFYVAMWDEGQQPWMLAGIATGAATLAVTAWVLLRTSRRLPIGTFFSISSALISVLAVVLTGKGVAALQQAGWIGFSVAPIPRIELLGIYPSWQPLLAQAVILVVLAAGYAINLRHAPHPGAAGAEPHRTV